MPVADKMAEIVYFIRQFLDSQSDKGGYEPGNRWFISANTRSKMEKKADKITLFGKIYPPRFVAACQNWRINAGKFTILSADSLKTGRHRSAQNWGTVQTAEYGLFILFAVV
jgi:hypothetical protein